jgi:ATP adenylyltransferase
VDVLWSPWRYDYITSSGKITPECIFCSITEDTARDEDNFVLARADHNFVVLNIYPYTTGHLMVVPYEHHSSPSMAAADSVNEMMHLVTIAETTIREVYSPDGLNIGMNLGKAAGAGVADHYHMHVLPRWVGDVNFMTAVGQTRTLPETLRSTYEKLHTRISTSIK